MKYTVEPIVNDAGRPSFDGDDTKRIVGQTAEKLVAAYDSGDGCHPNTTGESALEGQAFTVLTPL